MVEIEKIEFFSISKVSIQFIMSNFEIVQIEKTRKFQLDFFLRTLCCNFTPHKSFLDFLDLTLCRFFVQRPRNRPNQTVLHAQRIKRKMSTQVVRYQDGVRYTNIQTTALELRGSTHLQNLLQRSKMVHARTCVSIRASETVHFGPVTTFRGSNRKH